MLNPRVLSFCVFSDEDRVDIVVGGLVPLYRDAGSDVGEETECPSECQV